MRGVGSVSKVLVTLPPKMRSSAKKHGLAFIGFNLPEHQTSQKDWECLKHKIILQLSIL